MRNIDEIIALKNRIVIICQSASLINKGLNNQEIQDSIASLSVIKNIREVEDSVHKLKLSCLGLVHSDQEDMNQIIVSEKEIRRLIKAITIADFEEEYNKNDNREVDQAAEDMADDDDSK